MTAQPITPGEATGSPVDGLVLVTPRLRYVTRTAQRGARRVHVWSETPSAIEPTYAYDSTALCGGVDRQVLPHELPLNPDPFATPISASDVTCDRCWVLYERLRGALA